MSPLRTNVPDGIVPKRETGATGLYYPISPILTNQKALQHFDIAVSQQYLEVHLLFER